MGFDTGFFFFFFTTCVDFYFLFSFVTRTSSNDKGVILLDRGHYIYKRLLKLKLLM